jgi:uncharacterized protein (TIGR02757 family)
MIARNNRRTKSAAAMDVPGLKRLLDRLVRDYSSECLPLDPLELVRKHENPEDQEIAGFIAAGLALGRADLIRRAAGEVFQRMGSQPRRFVSRFDPRRDSKKFDGFVYRFFRSEDILLLIHWMHRAVREHGSLGEFFRSVHHSSDRDVGPSLSRFVSGMAAMDVPKSLRGALRKGSGLRHFLADPADGSACKRLNLYLRWMVRKDAIDLGLWTGIPSSKLIIPLDTHIARLGRKLGLTARNAPDWKMAVEITESLRRFDAEDPVKYDFALCTVGKQQACPNPPDRAGCGRCPLIRHCLEWNEARKVSSFEFRVSS